MFVAVGLPAVLLALPTFLWLPDKIDKVKWLSIEQKQWLKNELIKDEAEYDQIRHANPLHALKDKRVLLLALYYLPVTLSIYGLNLWLPTIIKQFGGGSDIQIGFLSSIPYIFGIIGLLIIPRSTDRLNDRYGHLSFLYALGACAMFLSGWLNSRQGMTGSAKAHYDGIVAFSQTDFTEDLKKITIPVLVLHGDDDQIVPYKTSGVKSAELLQNSQLKIYPGFSHGMLTVNHEVINADLLAFIRE